MNLVNLFELPIFWIASGVMFVVLSVVANLVTPKIRQAISQFSIRREVRQRRALILKKSEAVKKKFDVDRFYADYSLRANAKLSAIYWLIRGVLVSMIALMFIVLFPYMGLPKGAEFSAFFIAAIAFTISSKFLDKSFNLAQLAFLADKREEALTAHIRKHGGRNVDPSSFLKGWDQENIFKGVFTPEEEPKADEGSREMDQKKP